MVYVDSVIKKAMLNEDRERSWADIMSEEEHPYPSVDGTVYEPLEHTNETASTADAGSAINTCMEDDVCSFLMERFPVPGEIYIHLRSHCNYLASLVHGYTTNGARNPHLYPILINSWIAASATEHPSPFRIAYGRHNPAMHGVVLCRRGLIPNLSWVPHLVFLWPRTRPLRAW